MKRIQISGQRGIGKFAIVDNKDFDELNEYLWHLDSKGYANRWSQGNRKNRYHIYMHRVINKTPKGFETDHIDRNKLNNKKSNLRTATHALNGTNRETKNKSGYKGVNWKQNKWRACMTVNGKHKHLGYFENKADAHKAYLRANKKRWLTTTLT